MSKPVFSIQKLSCSYDKDIKNRVLYIDHLDIPRGELVFLLGSSGAGKSTLLETLGLMNDTVADGKILFAPEENSEQIELGSLWEDDGKSSASDIRKANYSFIFQNTNLMENFTAYENICLSKMIQKEEIQETAMQGARILMDKVGLPESQVGVDTLSVNLSGGQRQRVAFVRALNSDGKVLFGDEPTGNLDEGNANELMRVVKTYLGNDVTAIVVSHDISLALNHANRIICLTRNAEKGHGEVLDENIFTRNQWENMGREELLSFRDRLKKLYERKVVTPKGITSELETSKEVTTPPVKSGKFNRGFTSLFLFKEGQALAGTGMMNMIILTALMFFTFLAIGFANGSISYLQEKINNPFVNWLTVTVPWAKKNEQVDDMKQTLKNPDIKKRFKLKSVTSYTEMPLFLYSNLDKGFISARGRSIEMSRSYEDPMLSDIVGKQNLLKPDDNKSGRFRNFKDFSLIVTKRFMTEYGYDLNAPFIYFEVPVRDTTGKFSFLKMPVGVRAVVKEIPGKVQVAYTTYFYQAFRQNDGCAFDKRLKKEVIFYFQKDEKYANDLKKTIETILTKMPHYAVYKPEVETPKKNFDSYPDGYELRVSFFNNPENYLTLDSIYSDIVKDATFKPHLSAITRIYDYYHFDEHFKEALSNDELSVNFNRLDSVRSFAGFILKEFNEKDEIRQGGIIEVDISKVKEKENFNFLSSVTKAISFILIFFATLSVSLFVFNLLKMHLLKVKMNIGTFKAFGLGNTKAQNIYFIIIVRFLLISLSVALIAAFGVGFLLEKYFLPSVLTLDEGASYFKLIDNLTAVTVGLILFMALTVSWFTIRNILSKTPGDLIYNR